MAKRDDFDEDDDFDTTDHILIHDFDGYCIYKASTHSFVVRKPDKKGKACTSLVGYFTSLGGCARAIVNMVCTDKLAKRKPFMKKNAESFLTVIERHDAYVEKLVHSLNSIKPEQFPEIIPKIEEPQKQINKSKSVSKKVSKPKTTNKPRKKVII